MSIFRFFRSPLSGFRDLRVFLTTRKKHEIWMLLPALAVTLAILWGFYKDSQAKREWKRPEIIWVQNWATDRTDEQIRAQQAIDKVKQDADIAELKRRREAQRKDIKKIDDQLKSWGL